MTIENQQNKNIKKKGLQRGGWREQGNSAYYLLRYLSIASPLSLSLSLLGYVTARVQL